MKTYETIPGIGGRLLVGVFAEWPKHTSHWIDLRTNVAVLPEPGKTYWLEGGDGRDTIEQRLEKRRATLAWFMAESTRECSSVFYIFSGRRMSERPWQAAAACLMARYGWTLKHCNEIISELTGREPELGPAETVYKSWLERQTTQT